MNDIVLASRRYGQTESTMFYLRSANKYGVMNNDDYSDFANCNRFNTYSTSLECAHTTDVDLSHDLDAQIRLCAIPWE